MSDTAVNNSSSSNNAEEVPKVVDEPEDFNVVTQIQNRYTFWFRYEDKSKPQPAVVNYKESIKPVASFQSVERFWQIYDHLKRPNEFKTVEFHLFKDGIFPMWEDTQNKAGGKWTLRLKKGIASRYWEDILLAIIGEQFDVGSEICGAVLSVRINEDIISVWNKTADNNEAVTKIREQIRRILRLPNIISFEYKRHQDSLVDKSSYRNPTMSWRAPAKNLNDKEAPGARGGGGYNSYNKGGENRGTFQGQQGGEGGYKSSWSKPRWQESDGQPRGRDNRDDNRPQSEWRNPKHNNKPDEYNNRAPKSEQPTQGSSNTTAPSAPAPAAAAEPVARAPTGEVWTKVRNPFHKEDN